MVINGYRRQALTHRLVTLYMNIYDILRRRHEFDVEHTNCLPDVSLAQVVQKQSSSWPEWTKKLDGWQDTDVTPILDQQLELPPEPTQTLVDLIQRILR